jgi:hypothetical protein
MRPISSSYDQDTAEAVTWAIRVLRAVGYEVECLVTGAVLVDGVEIPDFERRAMEAEDVAEILL